MQFYRMEAGSLKMIFVSFYSPIRPKDFSVGVGVEPGGNECFGSYIYWFLTEIEFFCML